MKKYIEIQKTESGFESENAWLATCRTNSIPFITLKNKTKFIDVHWDYIAYSPENEKILHQLNGDLSKKAKDIFEKYANQKSQFRATDLLVWFKNMEPNNARLAAVELYDLITSYTLKTQ
jgi:hypothetical protein